MAVRHVPPLTRGEAFQNLSALLHGLEEQDDRLHAILKSIDGLTTETRALNSAVRELVRAVQDRALENRVALLEGRVTLLEGHKP